jgi:tetratricopeptide (TPR) repeat protein
MKDDPRFRFMFAELMGGKDLTAEQTEVVLQVLFNQKKRDIETAAWNLVRFYSVMGQQDRSMVYIEQLKALTDEPEKQASYYLAAGQLMEQVDDYESAVEFYRQAFSMEPVNNQTWYLINNNLGYSLVQLGQFENAEPYCRAAIEIEPRRYNAYKNLGLSLQGQGIYPEAALSFVESVKANPRDIRALLHLIKLMMTHPEISEEVPDLDEQVRKFREQVRIDIPDDIEGINQLLDKQ